MSRFLQLKFLVYAQPGFYIMAFLHYTEKIVANYYLVRIQF